MLNLKDIREVPGKNTDMTEITYITPNFKTSATGKLKKTLLFIMQNLTAKMLALNMYRLFKKFF